MLVTMFRGARPPVSVGLICAVSGTDESVDPTAMVNDETTAFIESRKSVYLGEL